MSQQDAANKLLWSNPDFAARYKLGERITGVFAGHLVQQLAIPSTPINLLDLASGLGIVVIKTFQARTNPEDKFTCADLSSSMLGVLTSRAQTDKWPTIPTIVECDMTQTGLESGYSHVTCSFGPGVTDADKVIAESYRLLERGGRVGYCQWKTVGWIGDFTRAFDAIRSDAQKRCETGGSEQDRKLGRLPRVVGFEELLDRMAGGSGEEGQGWAYEAHWKARLEAAGFEDVVVNVRKNPFVGTQDEVTQMIMPSVNVLKTFWTEEERQELADVDLNSLVAKWFDERFKQDDIKEGKIVWEDFVAMVITARKP